MLKIKENLWNIQCTLTRVKVKKQENDYHVQISTTS